MYTIPVARCCSLPRCVMHSATVVGVREDSVRIYQGGGRQVEFNCILRVDVGVEQLQ